ncbi:hypothetical protein [Bradyrhizobium sp. SZCCHNRI1058]|nr:hypothetical protein [Bradyrhizobium sp. SZCCHNRI1058]
MMEGQAERVRRIREALECGMHRAVEIDHALRLLDFIDRTQAV